MSYAYFYENQYWLCPICKVRFLVHIKNNISIFDSQKEEQNQQKIYQDREAINKKQIYQERRKNDLSIELKKNILNLCEKEKEKIETEKEEERFHITDLKRKQIFSERNKPKRINHYNNNKYYNNYVNININDHSQIIYSNYKRNDSHKNEIGTRFKTIQDNKENSKEKEKQIITTNNKNTKIIIVITLFLKEVTVNY